MRSHLLLASIVLAIPLTGIGQGNVRFVENKGQWPEQVRFLGEMAGASVWCEQGGILIDRYDATEAHLAHASGYLEADRPRPVIRHHAFRLRFSEAFGTGPVLGEDVRTGLHNYFIGQDPSRWASNASAFGTVHWLSVAPGARLRLTTTPSGLKYDVHIVPGADPDLVQFRYEGVESISLKGDKLVLGTSLGPVEEEIPLAYQVRDGERIPVECSYRLKKDVLGFKLGAYDPTLEVIIDPTLAFSTYSGSFSDNFGYTATFDQQGFLYSGSSSFGSLYPTTLGAYQTTWAGGDGQGTIVGTDMAISKYDTTGTFMVWSTMIGGQGDDLPHSLIVNSNNEVLILGTTGSPNFPTTAGAFDPSFNGGTPYTPQGIGVSYPNGSDMVVVRLGNAGSQLIASTFLGGTLNDGHNSAPALKFNYADEMRGEIQLDDDENVYILNCTQSSDYPVTPGAFQPVYGGGSHDGVVTQLDLGLTTLLSSTFFGGTGPDAVFGGEFHDNGDLAICGGTASTDLPATPGALNTSFQGGLADAFVARLEADASAIIACSYYGSTAYDQAYFVDLDDQDNVFLFGQTQAPGSQLIFNAPYNVPSSGQFIAKLNPDLSGLLLGSRFGVPSGSPTISPTAFLVDFCDKLYVSGWGSNIGIGPPLTTNGLPVTPDAYQPTTTGNDFYLAIFEVNMDSLFYATYFGGNISTEHVDGGTSRFDRRGRVYQSVCAGCGGHSDFPIEPNPGAVSATNNSTNCNNGVFKFDFETPLVSASANGPDTSCALVPIAFSNFSNGTSYLWDFGDLSTSTAAQPIHIYTSPGTYTVTLTAFDASTCNGQDQVSFDITILGAAPTMTAINDTLLCGPQSAFLLSAAGDGAVTSWHWSTNAQFSDMINASASDSTVLLLPVIPGTYYVRASNGGCVSIDSVTIGVSLTQVDITDDLFICADEEAMLQVAGADPNSTYLWAPASGIISGQGTASVVIAPSGTTVFTVLVTAPSGCTWNGSATVNVSAINGATVAATADPTIVLPGTTVQLNAFPDSGAQYLWSPVDGLDDPTRSDPLALVSETTWFVVTVSDGICTRSDSVLVTVYELNCDEPDVFVPNAFTPNGDGSNDILFVRGRFITELNLQIFDRWGEKVFETTDQSIGWDATFRGEPVDPAVFVYHLTVRCADGQRYFKKGNVTVIR